MPWFNDSLQGMRLLHFTPDKELYKRRNEVERFFRRLKRFRRIFTRYDKLDIIFAGFILLAMIIDSLVWTRPKNFLVSGIFLRNFYNLFVNHSPMFILIKKVPRNMRGIFFSQKCIDNRKIFIDAGIIHA